MAYSPGYRHDIFVSYAHVDDVPLPNVANGWATTLVASFKIQLAKKLGRAEGFSLWMDHELRGNEPVTRDIAEQLEESAMLLLIFSPAYLASTWCRWELSTFLDKTDKSLGRVFMVEQESAPILEELSDLRGYRFWEEDIEGNRHTLGWPTPNRQDVAFYKKLDTLASEVAHKLKGLKEYSNIAVQTMGNRTSKATIFLAEVTDDLLDHRDDMKRYFEQQRIQVLPSNPYYFHDASELHQALEADLQKSALFVQLLSPSKARRPPWMTTPEMQYETAGARGVPAIQWRHPKLDLREVTDRQERRLLDSPTVIAMPIEEFKQYIIQQLETRKAEKPMPSAKFVFVNTTAEAIDIAKKIGKILERRGIGFILPLWTEVRPAEKRQDLEGNLVTCDAVIVVYDKTTLVDWVRHQVRYCVRMAGQRDRPLRVIAIALCDEASKDKPPLDFYLPNMQILDCPSLCVDTCLPDFLAALHK